MGTPVWVNRYVAEADYRIGLGRVFPHTTHGYEGGYKLILPGVVGFDTILRDHSFNFASTSVPGVRDNPSRAETDNVGRMVGIDFLINVVVNHEALPCKAFAGAVEPVYARAVAYGDREIWGADVDRMADITLVTAGPGSLPAAGFDGEAVRRACTVTRSGGTVIVATDRPVQPALRLAAGTMADDATLNKLSRNRIRLASAPTGLQRIDAPPRTPRLALASTRNPVARQSPPRRVLSPPLDDGRGGQTRHLHAKAAGSAGHSHRNERHKTHDHRLARRPHHTPEGTQTIN